MGKYLTPRQWEKCIGGVAYKNKYTSLNWSLVLDEMAG